MIRDPPYPCTSKNDHASIHPNPPHTPQQAQQQAKPKPRMGVPSCPVEGLESLEELVGYLKNPNPQVRALGAQVALAVTATEASVWMIESWLGGVID